MKKEIRIVGLDDSPFDKFRDRKTLVVGTFFRGGSFLDGILTTEVPVDGTDSTQRIVNMLSNSKFRPQIRVVLLKGLAFAGLNIIDIQEIARKLKIPVIVVMRRQPRKDLKASLERLGMGSKVRLLEKAGPIRKVNHLYVQFAGCDEEFVRKIASMTVKHGNIPEPLRLAHIIASGIMDGESRGRA